MAKVREKLPASSEIIAPQGPQAISFLQSRADITFFGGVAGCEKTYSLLLAPLRHVQTPGFECVIFRRTIKETLKSGGMWDQSFHLYAGWGEPNKTHLQWKFQVNRRDKSGKAVRGESKITFAHLEQDTDRYDWKGAQINLIAFDQAETFTEAQFWYLLSRMRDGAGCGVRPYMLATCNPVQEDDKVGGWVNRLIRWWLDDNGQFANWEKSGKVRYFVRSQHDNTTTWANEPKPLRTQFQLDDDPMCMTFIPGKLEENKALLASDPGYKMRLMSLFGVERRRLLHGDWLVREQAGMFFQRDWFEIIDVAPANLVSIRYWDRAATEDDPKASWTAGCLLGRDRDGMYYILDMAHFQATPHGVQKKITNVASQDGKRVYVGIEQDPGQAGVAEAQSYVPVLAGYMVKANPVREKKGVRAKPLSAQAEGGNVKLVRGDWNDGFLKEAEHFDGSDKCQSDRIDAASGAFYMLTTVLKKRGAWMQTL